MTRKYQNHTLKTNPWCREEDAQNINSHETTERQLMYSNQLSLPQRDDCNNRVLISNSKYCITKQRPNTQNPNNGSYNKQ